MIAARFAPLGLVGAVAGYIAGYLWLVAGLLADSRGPAWFALKATGWFINRVTEAEGQRLLGLQRLCFTAGGATVGAAAGLLLARWWLRRPVWMAAVATLAVALAVPAALPFLTGAPVAGCWAYADTVQPKGAVSPREVLAMPPVTESAPRSGIAGLHVPLGRAGSEGICYITCSRCGRVEQVRYRLDPQPSPPGSGWRHLGLDGWEHAGGYRGYAGFDSAATDGALVLLSYAAGAMYADRYRPARPSELAAIAARWQPRR